MSVTGQKKYKRKVRLYLDQNGKCWWCKNRMLAPSRKKHDSGNLPDLYPTFEHLEDRFSPHRKTGQKIVLACRKCNCDRGAKRSKEWSVKHKDRIGRPSKCAHHYARIIADYLAANLPKQTPGSLGDHLPKIAKFVELAIEDATIEKQVLIEHLQGEQRA